MERVRQSKMTSCINIICSDTLNVYLSFPYNQISDHIETNKTSIRSGEPCFHQQFNQMLSMMQQCCLHCTSFTAIDLQNIQYNINQPGYAILHERHGSDGCMYCVWLAVSAR